MWLRGASRLAPAVRAAAVVALFIFLALEFCSIYFPLDETKLGGPGDFQPLVAMDWIVAKALSERGELPLWNPHVYTGLPLMGDPYISYFNPSIVVPLLLFGPINGPKVAVVVAVALAGVGQYWLSRVVGQGRAVAFAAGVLGMTAGSLVARFASGFNFYQSMQHAWQAATLAAFIVALRTGRPGAIALASGTYALLFHTGNIYLWLVLSVVLVLFGVGYSIGVEPVGDGYRLRLNVRALCSAMAVAAVAGLLAAVTALPTIEFRSLVDKAIDLGFRGTQPPLVTLLNFVVSDRRFWERELFGASDLGWGVHHAYLGAGAFVPLLFLVPALRARPSRDLPLLAVAFALAIAWASARHTFMWEVWQRWDIMRQLRYWSTATGAATVFLIPLALAGVDYLWRHAPVWGKSVRGHGQAPLSRRTATGSARRRSAAIRDVASLALLGYLTAIAADSWRTNQRLWHTPPYDAAADDVLRWLREHDNGAYAIESHNSLIVSVASVGHIGYGHSVLNSVWPPKPRLRPAAGAPDLAVLVPAPKYVVTRKVAQLPPGTLLAELPGGVVLRAPAGLPFSFVADPQRLPYGPAGATAVSIQVVQEAVARFDGTDRVVTQVPRAASPALSTLVVMQTWVPGWTVRGPSGVRPAENVGGFLGVSPVRAGETYEFSYFPRAFIVGAVLSGVGLIALGLLVAAEVFPRFNPFRIESP